jgi:putative cell wall-binding protein
MKKSIIRILSCIVVATLLAQMACLSAFADMAVDPQSDGEMAVAAPLEPRLDAALDETPDIEASVVAEEPETRADDETSSVPDLTAELAAAAFTPFATHTIDLSDSIVDGPGYTWSAVTKVLTFSTAANGNTYTLIQTGTQNVLGIVVANGVDTAFTLKDISLETALSCIKLEGNAKLALTLEGESSLESSRAGIEVTENTSLTILGGGELQTEGSYAGIGSGREGISGTIIIEDGIVIARSRYGAGIGGGDDGNDGGNITINGGTVTARGGGGAGIGGGAGGGSRYGIGYGWGGSGGVITIKGGDVTATGLSGAGIGGGSGGLGGSGGEGGTITISGGTVTATGRSDAGIGGGNGGSGTNVSGGPGGSGGIIMIKGGTVTATGWGAGIGGGFEGDGGEITIESGNITATSSGRGAGIGGGEDGDGGEITIVGGAVVASGSSLGGAGIGGGDGGDAGVITIANGDVTATGGGSGIGGGKGGGGGNITISDGTVMATGDGGGSPGIGGGYGGAGGNITISGGTVTAIGGSYGGAGISGGYGGAGSNITISGGTVTAIGSNGEAGIECGENDNITIANGTVTATGSGYCAGIGGSSGPGRGDGYGGGSDAGNIIIAGGTVTATGGESGGAGIGSGAGDYSGESGGGNIIIRGGNVTTTGGSYGGAGIGGGGRGVWVGEVTIEGGDVTTTGGGSGAGIGGGGGEVTIEGGDGGSITIEGGHVTATSSYGGAGIGGGGNGGNGGNIIIRNGDVIATSGGHSGGYSSYGGAGIGGGHSGSGGTITIESGTITAIGNSYGGSGIGGGSGKTGDPSTAVSIASGAEVYAFVKETGTPAIDAYGGNGGTGYYMLAYLDAVSYERTLTLYPNGAPESVGELVLPSNYASFARTTGIDAAGTYRIFAYQTSDGAYLGHAERVYDSSPDIASTRGATPTALRLNTGNVPTPPGNVPIPPGGDATAPSLSTGAATRASATFVTVSLTSNEAGSYYYAVVGAGALAPTINTSSYGIPLTAGTQTLSVHLSSAAAYDIYLVAKDAAGNVSATLKINAPAFAAPVTQHEGSGRQDTAARASAKAYPNPSQVDSVILAYSYDFPDALAASYLAGTLAAPILLCDTNEIPTPTATELSRLRPSAIYIVGGPGVISESIEGTLRSYDFTPTVTRLGGAERTETAYLIACEAVAQGGVPSAAFVVDAGNFPDALSAGSLSAGCSVPILLTDTGSLDGWTQRFLIENAIRDIIIVGGTGSVSERVAGQLMALSHTPAITRWSGTDRYETSKAVLDSAIAKWGISPSVIGLASGEDFPDALVGGAAIGCRGGLLAITDPDELSAGASTVIAAYKDTTLIDVEIFGGPGTIRVRDAVQALLT